MATHVGYTNGLVNGQIRSATASAGRFILHFVLMFVAMMIGMMPYHAIFGKSQWETQFSGMRAWSSR